MSYNGKSKPCKEYRFFVYEDGDFRYFNNVEERDKYADEMICMYCDDGWNEDVEQIICGEITHTCEKVNVVHHPPEDEIDEEGHDSEGNYWAEEWEYKCDYQMTKLEDVK